MRFFYMYCFSQFFTVLSQFQKWWKMYFCRNFYKLYRNGANNIPLKSYGKCETFSSWWFSLIPRCFQVISKTVRSFVLPLLQNRFFKNASCEVLELLWRFCLNFTLFFTCFFLLVALHSLARTLTGIKQVIHRWKAAINI